jgi:hypothetical protein
MLLRPPDGVKKVTVGEVTFKATSRGYFEIPNEDRFCIPLLARGFTPEVFIVPPVDKNQNVVKPVKQMTTHAVVVRCGCCGCKTTKEKEAHKGQPCPSPEATAMRNAHTLAGITCPNGRMEDLGMIQFYHRNPLRRWAWAGRRWLLKQLQFIKGTFKWQTS